MRNLKFGFFALLFLSAMAFEMSNIDEAKADVVKKSSSGRCHCPGGIYYNRTRNFTPYKTLEACLSSGGRHPKRGQGDCSKTAPEPGGPAIIKKKTRKIEGESSPGRPPNATSFPASAGTWRGLVVAEENRCSDYRRSEQYPYSPSVEDKVIEAMGGKIYEPYTGRYLASKEDTDIEHIVATAEGHDSGLCAATDAKRVEFATDPLNLTLATPSVNRCAVFAKCAKDAYEWLPPKNKCWFSQRVVDVRKKYGLTIDRREADLLEAVLSHCQSTEMIFY